MATKNRRIFELRLGKLGLILFVSGMSLLLFSSFLLGIVVGKHMEAYPERFSPGMAERIRDRLRTFSPLKGKEEPSTKAGNITAGDEERFDLTFYKTLGGEKEEQTAQEAGSEKGRPPESSVPVTATTNPPPLKEPSAKSADGSVVPMVPPVAGGEAKTPSPPPEENPAAETGFGIPEAVPPGRLEAGSKAVEERGFEIQVASHRDAKRAEQTVEALNRLGFASQVVEKDLPGKGKWFRVMIDGFETRQKAKAAAERIDAKVPGVECVVRSSAKD